MTIGQGNFLGTLRERYSDPLLTVLTALLLFMMFVVAPLQAAGFVVFQAFGVFAALAMMTGVLILSGSSIAVFALLVAISMNIFVIILRLRGMPSAYDLHMVAVAWSCRFVLVRSLAARSSHRVR